MIRSVGSVLWATERELVVDVPGWPGHRPGQFAMLTLAPDGPQLDPLLPRPMALFRAEGERLEFRFKIVGRGTALMAALPEGAALGVLGPLGNGFPEPAGRPLLVGGGTGIASLYELAGSVSGDARVLLGGRSREDILGLEEFEALPAELLVATDDGSLGHRGVVTSLLEPGPEDEIFACGPTAMLRSVCELARKGGARCWVALEAQMACGIGICLGCVVPGRDGFRYVCTHGPVFDAEELDWEKLP